ncbi:MAG: DUF2341 domain-containing protein [Candidatus Dojkabacteria bacterium]
MKAAKKDKQKLGLVKRILLLTSIFILLTGIPLLIYFFVVKQPELSKAWYNNNWLYRRAVTVSNSGSTLTNEDVLITLDTQSLITAGKLQSNCNDLRFVDSNDTTLLSYWIEGGCNTTSTKIWVRIPSLPSGGKTIYAYYGNTSAGSGQSGWSGVFYALSDTACANGWTRSSSFDGKFIYGSTTAGSTGGVASNHNHGGSFTVASSGGSAGSGVGGSDEVVCAPTQGHTHNVSGTVGSASSTPPYIYSIVCQKSDLSNLANIIMFSTTTPSGWTRMSAFDGRLPAGNATYGGTGGAATHSHTITDLSMAATTNTQCYGLTVPSPNQRGIAITSHTHPVSLTSNPAASNYPPYKSLLFVKSPATTTLGTNVIAMASAVPPLGWTQYTTMNNNFLMGAATANLTAQGSSTHTHNVSISLADTTSRQEWNPSSIVYANADHTHTTTVSLTNSNIPSYYSVIYIERKTSQATSVGGEEILNRQPNPPSSLLTNGATNPSGVISSSAYFSAVFSDPDTSDTGVYYQIQVNTNSSFTGTSMWDSGKKSMTPTANGARSPNISYAGSAFTPGTTYYWRIKFWDNAAIYSESSWSSTAQFTANKTPTAPTSLLTEGSTNPTQVVDLTPEFSAIFNDPDTSDKGVYYQIQVNTNSSFTGTSMWDSGKAAISPINNGARSPDISYAGTTLAFNGTTYYWRIKFWDNANIESSWSSTTQFTMNNQPNQPTQLETNGETNPTGVTTLTPKFTAIFSDSDTSDKGTYYQVQVNTNSSFTGTSMWDSGKTAFATPIDNNTRSSEITYNGTALQKDGTTYYWRIRFYDSVDIPSAWSNYASFRMLNIPAAPTNLTATALSTTSIRWTFDDNATGEEGVMLYDQNDNLQKICIGENITSCDEENLSENTQYTRYVVAYNSEAESNPSNTKSIYTLVSTPILTLVGKTDISVSLSSSQPANGAEVLFNCIEGCGTNINVWTPTISTTVQGLSNNTQYTFRVKARNGDNVESAYSDTISLYTHAAIPTLSAGPLSTTSISLSATGVNNLSSGSSGLYFECIGTGCNTGLQEWITSTSDVVIDLDPNTQYTFRAKARNFDAQETVYSNTVSTYTYATVPSLSDVHAISSSEISLKILNGANPSNTEFAVQETLTGKYVNLTTGALQATADWKQNNTPIVVRDLLSGTTYTFKVKARNGDNIETNFSATASATTFLNTVTAIAPIVNSASQITWRIAPPAEDILGIKVYDANGVLIKTCVGNNIEECAESSLHPSATYSRKFKVYNNIAESEFSNLVQATTYANVPYLEDLSVQDYTSESVTLTVNRNNNSLSTTYLIEEINSNKYLNATLGVLQNTPYYHSYSELGEENGIVVYGLSANTTYSFRIKARNVDLVETSFSPILTFTSLAASPQIISATAVNSSTIKVLINNANNPASTNFRVMETKSGNNIDPLAQTLVTNTIWNTYQVFGGTNGILVTNLQPNTQYSFCVKARNSDSLETSCSQAISAYTYPNNPSLNVRVVSSSSIEIAVNKNANPTNTKYQIVDTLTNGNLNNEAVLTNTTVLHSDERVSTSFTMNNLAPDTPYSFKVRSVNSDGLFSEWSQVTQARTWANTPKNLTFQIYGGSSGKLVFDRNGNPSSTRFAIQDSISGKYIDYSTKTLVDNVVWGTYNSWGATNGLLISTLDPGVQYTFRIKAINGANVETNFVEGNTGATYSIILNKAEGIETVLVDDKDVDVSNTSGAQTGEQKIRVLQENYIVADVPISFSQNRDWSNAVIESSILEGKSVVKLDDSHGLSGTFTMYVIKKEKDNSFRICPHAKTLAEVNNTCPEGVLYTGTFPQKLKVLNNEVTVSQASLSGTTYWIADGISGTGGQGEFIDKTTTSTTSSNLVTQVTTSVQQFFSNTQVLLDKTVLGNISEKELTTVSATTAAVTVSVGVVSALSGIQQIGYGISQIFINLFSSLGFRRKRHNAGYVYDSVTRSPIQQAIIRIYDSNHKLIDTSVTDGFGYWRSSAPTGEYTLDIKKREYIFPSSLIPGKQDYPLTNIYHGGKIHMKEGETNIVIPLDPNKEVIGKKVLTFSRGVFSVTLPILNIALFTAGITIAIYVYQKNTSVVNLIILLLYIPTIFTLVQSILNLRSKKGTVKYSDGTPATNITLLLKEKDFDKVISKRVTDEKGKYSFDILEEGKYAIESADSKIQIIEGETEIIAKKRKIVYNRLIVKKV